MSGTTIVPVVELPLLGTGPGQRQLHHRSGLDRGRPAQLDGVTVPPSSPIRYPDDTVHTEQDLFALTGATDEDSLAWLLFAEIDGAVHLEGEAGLVVWMGPEFENVTYPFSLETLKELARAMEAAEDRRLSGE